jgi:hypothetical protein
MIASGKIKQNGILLDNTYLTSNHIYNLAFNYTAERQYPPKLYTNSGNQTATTFLGQSAVVETMTLNTSGINYGSGIYELYSSTSYSDFLYTKKFLFDYISLIKQDYRASNGRSSSIGYSSVDFPLNIREFTEEELKYLKFYE